MASRGCETRPVAWKINYNKELAEASKEIGFEVWPFFIGCITSRDNLGRLEGDEYQLKGMFFPDSRYPQVTIDKVRQIRDCLVGKGLIIIYEVKGIKYMLLPKTGEYSGLVGNMSDKSDYPDPPEEIIKAWQERMNDVYTPSIRRINSVCTEGKGKGKIEGKGKELLYVDWEQSTLALWNSFCEKIPTLSKIKEISEKRRLKLKKRFEKESFREFSKILESIKNQPFLLGENGRSWKISFDWLIENDTNYLKVLEGRYKENNQVSEGLKKFVVKE